MTEKTMARMICTKMISGEEVLLNLSTVEGVVPLLVKTTPGVGKPFWYWPSIPVGRVIACDFTNAPIASSVTAANVAAMAAITALPEDVLTYEVTPPPAP